MVAVLACLVCPFCGLTAQDILPTVAKVTCPRFDFVFETRHGSASTWTKTQASTASMILIENASRAISSRPDY